MKIFGAIVMIFMFIVFMIDCIRFKKSKTIEEKQEILMDGTMYMLLIIAISVFGISFK